VRPPRDSSQSPSDEKILRYAAELFRLLGITKPEPDTVTWDDDIGPDLVVVKFGEARLPGSLTGRLTADDWKPWLAPAIIYNYLLLRDQNRDSTLHLLLPQSPAPILVAFSLIAIIRYTKPPLFTELLITLLSLNTI
jgi:hypothetical protein